VSFSFNPNSQFLAASSDKGTIHIFALSPQASGTGSGEDQAKPPPAAAAAIQSPSGRPNAAGQAAVDEGEGNKQSSFSFMRGLLPKYFSSEWSFAQFRVPETRTICAFGSEKNTIIGE
jgi:hypothetical protein